MHDANPYVQTPSDFPNDPAFPYVGEKWVDTTSVYGPAFTLASEPLALADGESADAAAWTYKTIAAVLLLVAAGLAAFLARGRRAFAFAFVGWNPLLALHFAGGGHNDVWMAGLVMGALALGATGRRQWAGVSWVAAMLIKWIPLVLLPLRIVEARANKRRVGHLGFAAAAAVLVAVSTWQFGSHWLGAAGAAGAERARGDAIRHPPPPRADRASPTGSRSRSWPPPSRARTPGCCARPGAGALGSGSRPALLLLATPYLVPWYAVWVVPLAAAEEDRAAQGLALVLCAYMLRQTIPL